jgi:hypothetical protein
MKPVDMLAASERMLLNFASEDWPVAVPPGMFQSV